ncbi:uncharacterized protein LOC128200961 [Galleria mellonella]|uniref:Uncharacterized protein LOC128200961 n=1 Tax=Galleria mellonella TaxID=7137 RepID=A0ABM3MLV3_GALME|nr:uncharacterized protein LOC128200961 [Galleria mellonella]
MMVKLIKNLLLYLFFIVFEIGTIDSANNSDVTLHDNGELLSRRKRFIVFPEGSSLQIVFCLTFPNINVMGDIILWGYTAALAYELPQDPYSPFMHHADPLHRRVDTKAIYYTNEEGRVLYKRPYKRKFIVNPAFAKRSIDFGSMKAEQFKKGTRENFKINRKQMHAMKNKRDFLKREHMEGRSIEFHRSSRGAFYQKIETMLQGLGRNGKECMLKTLCLIGQSDHHPQGSLLQEILRAVFTFPKSHNEDEVYSEYDAAVTSTEPCEKLYPECEEASEEFDQQTHKYSSVI